MYVVTVSVPGSTTAPSVRLYGDPSNTFVALRELVCPSPQAITIAVGVSAPGSVYLPIVSEYGEPSFTALAPDRVTVGATLVIVTAFDPAGLNVPSSSVIDAVMVKLFG